MEKGTGPHVIHWPTYLEQTLLTSSAFSAGALWQWWTQRGTCRGCRIRYSVRRVLNVIAQRIAQKAKGEPEAFKAIFRVLEVALAFAFWDTMKLAWYLVAVPYFNQKVLRKTRV